jgi:hypothetical protein
MALHWTFLVAVNVNLAKLVAVPKISHFETEQAISVDESQRVASIHRKRANHVLEGPHCTCDSGPLDYGPSKSRGQVTQQPQCARGFSGLVKSHAVPAGTAI